MKLYKVEQEIGKPTLSQLNVDTNTDFYLGVDLTENGKDISKQVLPNSISCSGDVEATASTIINGQPYMQLKAGGDEADKKLTLNISQGMIDGAQADNDDFAYQVWDRWGTQVSRWDVKRRIVMRPEVLANYEENAPYMPFEIGCINRYNPSAPIMYCNDYECTYPSAANPSKESIWLEIKTSANNPTENAGSQIWIFSLWDDVKKKYVWNIFNTTKFWFASELVLDVGDYITMKQDNGTIGYFKFGKEINSSFPLTINENKTTTGDVEKLDVTKTVNFSGIYTDNTEFNYDVFVK